MNVSKALGATAALVLMLSGCATTTDNEGGSINWCMAAGTAVGGGVAGAEISAPAGPVGAVLGAVIGYYLCEPGDADGDGVLDGTDKCPGTPAGINVNAAGCEVDSDRDGVVDSKDSCPSTKAGVKVNAMGCELDSDSDGVVDSLDLCPNTKSGIKVDLKGCAIPEPKIVPDGCDKYVSLKDGKLVNGAPILFDFNSDEVSGEGEMILICIAKVAMRTDVKQMEVAGFTDSVGSQAYNKKLSERRAKNARDVLITQGINSGQVTIHVYGMDKPVANNSTEANRAKNRRVEVLLKK